MRKRNILLSSSIVTLVVLGLVARWADAQDNKYTRPSLKGLDGVNVIVEKLPECLRYILHQKTVQTDTELRLRKAGIRVLTEEEFLSEGIGIALYVRVNGLENRTVENSLHGFFYEISVHLDQFVRLVRDPSTELFATTWSQSRIGACKTSEVAKELRERVNDSVDMFINAYLSANPKKPDAVKAATQQEATPPRPSGMFGTQWLMSKQEVQRIRPEASPSDADDDILTEMLNVFDQNAMVNYRFGSDELVYISVTLLGGSTKQSYLSHHQQIVDLYGAMPTPMPTERHVLASEKKIGRIVISHILTMPFSGLELEVEQLLLFRSQ